MEEIKFLDCTTFNCWFPADEIKDKTCMVCTAYGRVAHEDKKQVTLVTMDGEGSVGFAIAIPRKAILKRRKIRG